MADSTLSREASEGAADASLAPLECFASGAVYCGSIRSLRFACKVAVLERYRYCCGCLQRPYARPSKGSGVAAVLCHRM